jgi:hypothetical protein
MNMITDQSDNLRVNNGVIETHSGERVIGCFPEVERISMNDADDLTFPLSVFPSYEVSLIRVYQFQGEWKISTNKKLDAYDSYWSSEFSFGWKFDRLVQKLTEMPEIGLDVFLKSLCPAKGYFFLIPLEGTQRTGNAREHTKDKIWLAGIEEGGQINLDTNEAPNIWSTLSRVVFETPSELKKYIEEGYKHDDPPLTGAMLCDSKKHIRILHPEYLRLYELRKNEPNIYKRYLEIENQQDSKQFFNQHIRYLSPFARDLHSFIIYLHGKYLERYVQRKFQMLPSKVHAVIKTCHGEYLKDRTNRITRARLRDILHTSFPPDFILNTMAEEVRSRDEQCRS